MPIYSYKAIDQEGKTVRGKLIAENDLDLEYKLKDQKMDLINSREVKESSGLVVGSVSMKDKVMLCVQLQQLDKAGVPILESLGDLRETIDNPKLKQIIADVYETVRNGSMLSEALKKHPKTFDNVFVGLVAAGEKTGNLHESFGSLAEHIKWNMELKRKVKKAMAYPIFTLVVVAAAIGFMAGFVFPKIKDFLQAQGREMPIQTRLLIDTSDFIVENWLILLITPLLITVAVKVGKKFSPKFQFMWDSLMLKLPIVGPATQKIDLARFTRFFGILYTSGIDILECLNVGQQVVANRVIKQSILDVMQTVSEGSSMNAALKSTGQFPSLVLRMFKIGEDSGRMREALENVNYFYDKEVNDTIDAIVGVSKPVMIIFVAGVVIWQALAMFGPVFDIIQNSNF